MDKHIGKDNKFGKTYQEYFHLHYDRKGIFRGADERTDVIERELQLCGYFCIITSEKMTASQALIQYKGRDISEKLFRADKTFIGSKSERVQSSQSMSAKIFIEFVALIVRNRIYNLLKEQMLRMEAKQKYMTVPAAIRELEKIEMVRRNGGTYKLDHAVTKTQKIILSSFGLDADSITTPVGSRYRLEFLVPSRGLFGYRNEFLTDTRGEGIMSSVLDSYAPMKGEIERRLVGSLIAHESGEAVTYGLGAAQERGYRIL